MTELTSDEHFLLDWLAKEDHSAYGECRGRALDRLLDAGLARTVHVDDHDINYNRVALTAMGVSLLRELGPHELSRP
jgi:hypothetical protein